MEKEYVNGEKAQMAQIWISVPKRHDKVIFCAVVAGVILLLTILLIRGNGLCVAAGILMAFLAIGVHFLMQKRITIANLIFYFDRGEIYLVSCTKKTGICELIFTVRWKSLFYSRKNPEPI